MEVQALGDDTRLSAIVRLLERAQGDKPKLAELADRVAQWFLLVVLVVASIVGLVWWQIDPQRAFWIVLALLVATCPAPFRWRPPLLTAATGTLHKLGLLLTRGHVGRPQPDRHRCFRQDRNPHRRAPHAQRRAPAR